MHNTAWLTVAATVKQIILFSILLRCLKEIFQMRANECAVMKYFKVMVKKDHMMKMRKSFFFHDAFLVIQLKYKLTIYEHVYVADNVWKFILGSD